MVYNEAPGPVGDESCGRLVVVARRVRVCAAYSGTGFAGD